MGKGKGLRMDIVKGSIANLTELAELFNQYRVFYHQASDLEGARAFLKDRLEHEESVVFLLREGDEAIGFAQCFPSFSSVSMKRTWILNDLFIKKEARRKGYGEKLLQQVIQFAKDKGTKGILLETNEDNFVAQNLYEKSGFKREMNRFYFRNV